MPRSATASRVEVTATVLVDLPPTKLARLTPDVLERETDRSIHLYGGLAFGEMLVLTITRDRATIGRESYWHCSMPSCWRWWRRPASPAHAPAVTGPGAGTPAPGRPRQPPADLRRPCSRPLLRILCAGEIRVGVRTNYPLFATSERRRARRLRHRRGPGDRRAARRPAGVGAGAGGDAHRGAGGGRGRPRRRHDGPQHAARRAGAVHPAALLPVRDDRRRPARDHGPRLERPVGPLASASPSATTPTPISSRTARDCCCSTTPAACRAAWRTRPASWRRRTTASSRPISAIRRSRSRFERKFGFDPVPWGMAVPKADSERLAQALELISQIMHRDGEFLALARRNGIFTTFLEQQHDLLARARLRRHRRRAAIPPASCRHWSPSRPPPASHRTSRRRWHGSTHHLGIVLAAADADSASRPGSCSRRASPTPWLLVLGTLAATLLVALVVGAASAASSVLLRAPAWLVVVTLQSSPVVLTLVIAARSRMRSSPTPRRWRWVRRSSLSA